MGKKGSAHPADEQRRKEKLKEQKKVTREKSLQLHRNGCIVEN